MTEIVAWKAEILFTCFGCLFRKYDKNARMEVSEKEQTSSSANSFSEKKSSLP